MNSENFSFLKYLNHKGLYYKTNVIEEFLLTLKIDNIILLNGIKGIGKTSLAKSYIEYYNLENNINKSIKSTFKIGKTITSKGFVVKRINSYDILPHMIYEDECYCDIEGIRVKGKLNILPRFFFKPQENKEFMDYLVNESDKINKNLYFELFLDKPSINNYLLINANKINTKDIESFIKTCEKEINIPHYIIFDNVNENNIDNILYKRYELPSNLKLIYTGLISNLSNYIDGISVINISENEPIDYLQNNMENVNLANITYLEKINDEKINNINVIRSILLKIYVQNNKTLYNTLLDELNNLYYILNKEDIHLTNQIINDILNYIIVGWKYENKPDIFDNWKKYYDCQIAQKIIPLVENKGNYSKDIIDELINYCNNENSYYRSYNILINMNNK